MSVLYYGTNPETQKQITIDRRNSAVSANRIICGKSGTGKTFLIHDEIKHIFAEAEDAVFELTNENQLPFTLEALQRNHEKGRKTWIFVDEISAMLYNCKSAELLCKLAGTAERYSGILTLATQDMCSLFETETGNIILTDMNFMTFLSLTQKGRKVLCRYFGEIIPECVIERYCKDVPCGNGISIMESKLLNPDSTSHIEVVPFVFQSCH